MQCADWSRILSQYRQDRSGGLVDMIRWTGNMLLCSVVIV